MADTAAGGVLATRYARALDIAIVVITGGWHVGGAGPLLLAHLGDFASPATQLVCWALLALVIAAAATLLLTGRGNPAIMWPLVAATLTINAVVAFTCPQDRVLETDWAWGSAGWAAVVLLLRRPLRALIAVLAVMALTMVAALVADWTLHRLELAGFVTMLYGNVSIQVAATILSRVLGNTAHQAVDAALAEAEVTTEQLVAERVHAGRQTRYRDLQGVTSPLLRGLAAGELSPADQDVRLRCRSAATRLRRLFAESDDAPDPLLHELRACADSAERRGVRIEIETPGPIPALTPAIRRELTEAVVDVLMTARSQARITVLAAPREVAVSVVADSPMTVPQAAGGAAVAIDAQRDGADLWVEARWTAP
jgi:hypothetical protein